MKLKQYLCVIIILFSIIGAIISIIGLTINVNIKGLISLSFFIAIVYSGYFAFKQSKIGLIFLTALFIIQLFSYKINNCYYILNGSIFIENNNNISLTKNTNTLFHFPGIIETNNYKINIFASTFILPLILLSIVNNSKNKNVILNKILLLPKLKYYKYILLILITIALSISSSLSAQFQLFVATILYYLLTLNYYNRNPNSITFNIKHYLYFIPLFITYAITPFLMNSPQKSYYPYIWISVIVVCIMAYGFSKTNSIIRKLSIIPVILFVYLFQVLVIKNSESFSNLSECIYNSPTPYPNLTTLKGDTVTFEKYKGKTIVADCWRTSCFICIEDFPEFDKMAEEYKNDTNIVFCIINFPLKRDSGLAEEIIRKKNPKTLALFAKDRWADDTLKVYAVPSLLIIDKKQQLRYSGTYNQGWNAFINNTDQLIEKIHNE